MCRHAGYDAALGRITADGIRVGMQGHPAPSRHLLRQDRQMLPWRHRVSIPTWLALGSVNGRCHRFLTDVGVRFCVDTARIVDAGFPTLKSPIMLRCVLREQGATSSCVRAKRNLLHAREARRLTGNHRYHPGYFGQPFCPSLLEDGLIVLNERGIGMPGSTS